MRTKKIMAAFTAFCFLFQTIAFSAPELIQTSYTSSPKEMTLGKLDIDIPQELGQIQKVYQSPVGTGVIVHIQDAHGNYEAQQNIRSVIQHLRDHYGINLLLMEGADEKLDPGIMRFFDDQRLNEKVADILMKYGEFTGAEMHLLSAVDGAVGYGIEKTELYRKDVELFRQVIRGADVTKPYLESVQGRIRVLESRIFSKELRDFVKEWRKEEGERANLLGFISVLAKQVESLLSLDLKDPVNQDAYPAILRVLKLKDIEANLDAKKIEAEKAELLNEIKGKVDAELYEALAKLDAGKKADKRMNPRFILEKIHQQAKGLDYARYPHFSNYAAYLVFQAEIQSEQLFRESQELSDKLFQIMAKSEEEKSLLGLIKDEVLLTKLYNLELSRDNYLEIETRKSVFAPEGFEARIAGMENGKKNQPEDLSDAVKLFAGALEFYQVAQAREEHFIENAVRTMKETDKTKAVVVTGGFHAEGFEAMVKAKGLSYILVSPRITDIKGSHEIYLNAMLGKTDVSPVQLTEDVKRMVNEDMSQSQVMVATHLEGEQQQIALWGGEETTARRRFSRQVVDQVREQSEEILAQAASMGTDGDITLGSKEKPVRDLTGFLRELAANNLITHEDADRLPMDARKIMAFLNAKGIADRTVMAHLRSEKTQGVVMNLRSSTFEILKFLTPVSKKTDRQPSQPAARERRALMEARRGWPTAAKIGLAVGAVLLSAVSLLLVPRFLTQPDRPAELPAKVQPAEPVKGSETTSEPAKEITKAPVVETADSSKQEISESNPLLANPVLKEAHQTLGRSIVALRTPGGLPYNQTRGAYNPGEGWLKSSDIGMALSAEIVLAANAPVYPAEQDFQPQQVTARVKTILDFYEKAIERDGLRVRGVQTGILPEFMSYRGDRVLAETHNIPGTGRQGIPYAAYDMAMTVEWLMRVAEIFKGGVIKGLKDDAVARQAKHILDQTNLRVFVGRDGRLHSQVFLADGGEFVYGSGVIDNKHTEAKMFLPLIYGGYLGDPSIPLEERVAQGKPLWKDMSYAWDSRRIGGRSYSIARGDGGLSALTEYYGNLAYDEAALAPQSEGVSHRNYLEAAIALGKQRGHQVFVSAPGTGKNADEYAQFGINNPSVLVPVGSFLALTTGTQQAVGNVGNLVRLTQSGGAYDPTWGWPDALDPLTGRPFNGKRIFQNQTLQLLGLNYHVLRGIEAKMPWHGGVANAIQDLDKEHAAPPVQTEQKAEAKKSKDLTAEIRAAGAFTQIDRFPGNSGSLIRNRGIIDIRYAVGQGGNDYSGFWGKLDMDVTGYQTLRLRLGKDAVLPDKFKVELKRGGEILRAIYTEDGIKPGSVIELDIAGVQGKIDEVTIVFEGHAAGTNQQGHFTIEEWTLTSAAPSGQSLGGSPAVYKPYPPSFRGEAGAFEVAAASLGQSAEGMTRRVFISRMRDVAGFFATAAILGPAGCLAQEAVRGPVAGNPLLARQSLKAANQILSRSVVALRTPNGLPYNQTRGAYNPGSGWLKSSDLGMSLAAEIVMAANQDVYPGEKDFQPQQVTARVKTVLDFYEKLLSQYGLRFRGKPTGILPEFLSYRGGQAVAESHNIPGTDQQGIVYAAYDMAMTVEWLMRIAEIFKGGVIAGLKDENISSQARRILDQTNLSLFVDNQGGLHSQIFLKQNGELVFGQGVIDNKHTEAKMFLPLIYAGYLGTPENGLEARIQQGKKVWEKLFFEWDTRRIGERSYTIARGDGGLSAFTEYYGNLAFDEAGLAPQTEGVSHKNYLEAAIALGQEKGHKLFVSAPGTGKNPDEYAQFGINNPSVLVPVGPFLALTTGADAAVTNVETLIGLIRTGKVYDATWGWPDALDPVTGQAFNGKRIFQNQVLQLLGLNYPLLRAAEARMPWHSAVANALRDLDKAYAPAARTEQEPTEAKTLDLTGEFHAAGAFTQIGDYPGNSGSIKNRSVIDIEYALGGGNNYSGFWGKLDVDATGYRTVRLRLGKDGVLPDKFKLELKQGGRILKVIYTEDGIKPGSVIELDIAGVKGKINEVTIVFEKHAAGKNQKGYFTIEEMSLTTAAPSAKSLGGSPAEYQPYPPSFRTLADATPSARPAEVSPLPGVIYEPHEPEFVYRGLEQGFAIQGSSLGIDPATLLIAGGALAATGVAIALPRLVRNFRANREFNQAWEAASDVLVVHTYDWAWWTGPEEIPGEYFASRALAKQLYFRLKNAGKGVDEFAQILAAIPLDLTSGWHEVNEENLGGKPVYNPNALVAAYPGHQTLANLLHQVNADAATYPKQADGDAELAAVEKYAAPLSQNIPAETLLEQARVALGDADGQSKYIPGVSTEIIRKVVKMVNKQSTLDPGELKTFLLMAHLGQFRGGGVVFDEDSMLAAPAAAIAMYPGQPTGASLGSMSGLAEPRKVQILDVAEYERLMNYLVRRTKGIRAVLFDLDGTATVSNNAQGTVKEKYRISHESNIAKLAQLAAEEVIMAPSTSRRAARAITFTREIVAHENYEKHIEPQAGSSYVEVYYGNGTGANDTGLGRDIDDYALVIPQQERAFVLQQLVQGNVIPAVDSPLVEDLGSKINLRVPPDMGRDLFVANVTAVLQRAGLLQEGDVAPAVEPPFMAVKYLSGGNRETVIIPAAGDKARDRDYFLNRHNLALDEVLVIINEPQPTRSDHALALTGGITVGEDIENLPDGVFSTKKAIGVTGPEAFGWILDTASEHNAFNRIVAFTPQAQQPNAASLPPTVPPPGAASLGKAEAPGKVEGVLRGLGLAGFAGFGKPRPRRARPTGRRLGMESLEDRVLLIGSEIIPYDLVQPVAVQYGSPIAGQDLKGAEGEGRSVTTGTITPSADLTRADVNALPSDRIILGSSKNAPEVTLVSIDSGLPPHTPGTSLAGGDSFLVGIDRKPTGFDGGGVQNKRPVTMDELPDSLNVGLELVWGNPGKVELEVADRQGDTLKLTSTQTPAAGRALFYPITKTAMQAAHVDDVGRVLVLSSDVTGDTGAKTAVFRLYLRPEGLEVLDPSPVLHSTDVTDFRPSGQLVSLGDASDSVVTYSQQSGIVTVTGNTEPQGKLLDFFGGGASALRPVVSSVTSNLVIDVFATAGSTINVEANGWVPTGQPNQYEEHTAYFQVQQMPPNFITYSLSGATLQRAGLTASQVSNVLVVGTKQNGVTQGVIQVRLKPVADLSGPLTLEITPRRDSIIVKDEAGRVAYTKTYPGTVDQARIVDGILVVDINNGKIEVTRLEKPDYTMSFDGVGLERFQVNETEVRLSALKDQRNSVTYVLDKNTLATVSTQTEAFTETAAASNDLTQISSLPYARDSYRILQEFQAGPYETNVTGTENSIVVNAAGQDQGGGTSFDNFQTKEIETADLSGRESITVAIVGNRTEARFELVSVDDKGHETKWSTIITGLKPGQFQTKTVPLAEFVAQGVDLTRLRLNPVINIIQGKAQFVIVVNPSAVIQLNAQSSDGKYVAVATYDRIYILPLDPQAGKIQTISMKQMFPNLHPSQAVPTSIRYLETGDGKIDKIIEVTARNGEKSYMVHALHSGFDYVYNRQGVFSPNEQKMLTYTGTGSSRDAYLTIHDAQTGVEKVLTVNALETPSPLSALDSPSAEKRTVVSNAYSVTSALAVNPATGAVRNRLIVASLTGTPAKKGEIDIPIPSANDVLDYQFESGKVVNDGKFEITLKNGKVYEVDVYAMTAIETATRKTSPDGRYRAVLENGNLTVGRIDTTDPRYTQTFPVGAGFKKMHFSGDSLFYVVEDQGVTKIFSIYLNNIGTVTPYSPSSITLPAGIAPANAGFITFDRADNSAVVFDADGLRHRVNLNYESQLVVTGKEKTSPDGKHRVVQDKENQAIFYVINQETRNTGSGKADVTRFEIKATFAYYIGLDWLEVSNDGFEVRINGSRTVIPFSQAEDNRYSRRDFQQIGINDYTALPEVQVELSTLRTDTNLERLLQGTGIDPASLNLPKVGDTTPNGSVLNSAQYFLARSFDGDSYAVGFSGQYNTYSVRTTTLSNGSTYTYSQLTSISPSGRIVYARPAQEPLSIDTGSSYAGFGFGADGALYVLKHYGSSGQVDSYDSFGSRLRVFSGVSFRLPVADANYLFGTANYGFEGIKAENADFVVAASNSNAVYIAAKRPELGTVRLQDYYRDSFQEDTQNKQDNYDLAVVAARQVNPANNRLFELTLRNGEKRFMSIETTQTPSGPRIDVSIRKGILSQDGSKLVTLSAPDFDAASKVYITDTATNQVTEIAVSERFVKMENVSTVEVLLTAKNGREFILDLETNTVISQTSPFDVNGTGTPTPLGALRIINLLNQYGSIDKNHPAYRYIFDVNRDGHISPLDVLMIINELNRRSMAEAEGEPVSVAVVEHPVEGRVVAIQFSSGQREIFDTKTLLFKRVEQSRQGEGESVPYTETRPVISAIPASTTGNLTIRWGAVESPTRYRVQVSTSPTFAQNTIVHEGFPGENLEPVRLTATARYYVRVQGYRGPNFEEAIKTQMSNPVSFVADLIGFEQAKPVVQSIPDSMATDVTLRWEPIQGATGYRVQVSTSPFFIQGTIVREGFPSGTQESVTLELRAQRYYVRVQGYLGASFEQGLLTAVSDTVSFMVDLTPFLQAVPAIESIPTSTTGDAVISWAAVPKATGYRVQVSTSPAFTQGTIVHEGFPGVNQEPVTFTATGRYYVRVQGYKGANFQQGIKTKSASSPSFIVDLIGITQAKPFVYPIPLNLSGKVSIHWNLIPGATGYRVQVATSPSFTADAIVLDTTTNKQNNLFLGAARQYYARVQGYLGPGFDQGLTTQVSDTIPFTIDLAWLEKSKPSMQPVIKTTTSDVTLRWQEMPDVSGYRVELSTDPAFSTGILFRKDVSGNETAITLPNYTGVYYVRVQGYIGPSFETGTKSQFSDPTRILADFIGFQQMIPHVFPIQNSTNGQVNIGWEAVPAATGYRVQVLSEGMTLVHEEIVTKPGVSLTLIRSGRAEYTVRVTAFIGPDAANGMVTKTAITAPFTVDLTAFQNSAPVIQPIAAGKTGDVEIQWSTVANATGYRLEVSTTPDFAAGTIVYTGNSQETRQVAHIPDTGVVKYYARVQGYLDSGAGQVVATNTSQPATFTRLNFDNMEIPPGSGDKVVKAENVSTVEVLLTTLSGEEFIFDLETNEMISQASPFDVNGTGTPTPLGVLRIINFLNQFGSVDKNHPAYRYIFDIDRNGIISALDVLLLINYLNNRASAVAEGEPVSVAVVEHPVEGKVVAIQFSSGQRELFDAQTLLFKRVEAEGEYPAGWASTDNSNYAYQITRERLQSGATAEILSLKDVRTGGVQVIWERHTIPGNYLADEVNVSPDTTPGGPVVVYGVGQVPVGASTIRNEDVVLARISNPAESLTITSRELTILGENSGLRKAFFTTTAAGHTVAVVDLGIEFQSGTVIQDEYAVNLTAGDFQAGTPISTIVAAGPNLHAENNSLVIQPEYVLATTMLTAYLYEDFDHAKIPPDTMRLRLLSELPLGYDSTHRTTFSLEDAYVTPSGREVAIIGVDTPDTAGTFNTSYSTDRTFIKDPRTGDVRELPGAATAVIYDKALATFTLPSGQTTVNLDTFEVQPAEGIPAGYGDGSISGTGDNYRVRVTDHIFGRQDEVDQVLFPPPAGWPVPGVRDTQLSPVVTNVQPPYGTHFAVIRNGERTVFIDSLARQFRIGLEESADTIPDFIFVNGVPVPVTVTPTTTSPIGWRQFEVAVDIDHLRGDGTDQVKVLAIDHATNKLIRDVYYVNGDASAWVEIAGDSRHIIAVTAETGRSRSIETGLPANASVLSARYDASGKKFTVQTASATSVIDIETGTHTIIATGGNFTDLPENLRVHRIGRTRVEYQAAEQNISVAYDARRLQAGARILFPTRLNLEGQDLVLSVDSSTKNLKSITVIVYGPHGRRLIKTLPVYKGLNEVRIKQSDLQRARVDQSNISRLELRIARQRGLEGRLDIATGVPASQPFTEAALIKKIKAEILPAENYEFESVEGLPTGRDNLVAAVAKLRSGTNLKAHVLVYSTDGHELLHALIGDANKPFPRVFTSEFLKLTIDDTARMAVIEDGDIYTSGEGATATGGAVFVYRLGQGNEPAASRRIPRGGVKVMDEVGPRLRLEIYPNFDRTAGGTRLVVEAPDAGGISIVEEKRPFVPADVLATFPSTLSNDQFKVTERLFSGVERGTLYDVYNAAGEFIASLVKNSTHIYGYSSAESINRPAVDAQGKYLIIGQTSRYQRSGPPSLSQQILVYDAAPSDTTTKRPLRTITLRSPEVEKASEVLFDPLSNMIRVTFPSGDVELYDPTTGNAASSLGTGQGDRLTQIATELAQIETELRRSREDEGYYAPRAHTSQPGLMMTGVNPFSDREQAQVLLDDAQARIRALTRKKEALEKERRDLLQSAGEALEGSSLGVESEIYAEALNYSKVHDRALPESILEVAHDVTLDIYYLEGATAVVANYYRERLDLIENPEASLVESEAMRAVNQGLLKTQDVLTHLEITPPATRKPVILFVNEIFGNEDKKLSPEQVAAMAGKIAEGLNQGDLFVGVVDQEQNRLMAKLFEAAGKGQFRAKAMPQALLSDSAVESMTAKMDAAPVTLSSLTDAGDAGLKADNMTRIRFNKKAMKDAGMSLDWAVGLLEQIADNPEALRKLGLRPDSEGFWEAGSGFVALIEKVYAEMQAQGKLAVAA